MDLLVNYGIRASSLAPSFGTYELLYEETVAHNKTQIDITGLNIGKDDGLRLVYTAVGTNNFRIYPNDQSTTTNYWFQYLLGDGSSLFAGRINEPRLAQPGDGFRSLGFVDIKVSNNDRFVAKSQFVQTRSGATDLSQWNFNIVGTQSISSITKLSIVSTNTNGIASGSRIALYRISGGGA